VRGRARALLAAAAMLAANPMTSARPQPLPALVLWRCSRLVTSCPPGLSLGARRPPTVRARVSGAVALSGGAGSADRLSCLLASGSTAAAPAAARPAAAARRAAVRHLGAVGDLRQRCGRVAPQHARQRLLIDIACVPSALPRSTAALVRLAPRAYLKYKRARAAAATARTVLHEDDDDDDDDELTPWPPLPPLPPLPRLPRLARLPALHVATVHMRDSAALRGSALAVEQRGMAPPPNATAPLQRESQPLMLKQARVALRLRGGLAAAC
jgi:hypothetical protein